MRLERCRKGVTGSRDDYCFDAQWLQLGLDFIIMCNVTVQKASITFFLLWVFGSWIRMVLAAGLLDERRTSSTEKNVFVPYTITDR